ncbi:MAG: hypothetical protein ACKPGJ_20250, partial [Dolichospermum sp.]
LHCSIRSLSLSILGLNQFFLIAQCTDFVLVLSMGSLSNRYPVMILVKTDIFSNAIAVIFQMRILLYEQRPRALNIPRR